ncbi:MAG: InlB B-repeat-containing protein [Oscillospiraceae bacterium]|nr:InlB B-repeat-containing protein [Oscillospiraceae bacterium]
MREKLSRVRKGLVGKRLVAVILILCLVSVGALATTGVLGDWAEAVGRVFMPFSDDVVTIHMNGGAGDGEETLHFPANGGLSMLSPPAGWPLSALAGFYDTPEPTGGTRLIGGYYDIDYGVIPFYFDELDENETVELWARWSADMTFDVNGGTFAAAPGEDYIEVFVTRGQDWSDVAVPTGVNPSAAAGNDGYEFVGWFDTSNPTGGNRLPADGVVGNNALSWFARFEIPETGPGTMTFHPNYAGQPAITVTGIEVGDYWMDIMREVEGQMFSPTGWIARRYSTPDFQENTLLLEMDWDAEWNWVPTIVEENSPAEWWTQWENAVEFILGNTMDRTPIVRGDYWDDVTAPDLGVPGAWDMLGWFCVDTNAEKPTTGLIQDENGMRRFRGIAELTLNFHGNDGTLTGPSSVTVRHGDLWGDHTLPTVAPPANMIFLGWFDTPDPSGGTRLMMEDIFVPADPYDPESEDEIIIARVTWLESTEWYARFIINDGNFQTIIFDANTGWFPNAAMDSVANREIFRMGNLDQAIAADGSLLNPPLAIPENIEQRFVGWFNTPDPTGGTQVTHLTPVDTAEAVVFLWARWEPEDPGAITHTVTFIHDGQIVGGAGVPVTHGQFVTEPNIDLGPDFTFEGWFDEAGFRFDFENTPILADRTLTSRFARTHRSLTFLGNGGTPAETSVRVAIGSIWSQVSTPTIEIAGVWTQFGWFNTPNPTGGDSLASLFGLIPSEGHGRWYARFGATINFNANGGTMIGNGNVFVVRGQNWDDITVPNVNAPANWTFAGWYTAPTGGTRMPDAGAITDTNIAATFYARWTRQVEFNPGTGTGGGTVAVIRGQDWSDIAIPSVTPPTAGWGVIGWYNAPTGGTPMPTEGAILTAPPATFWPRFGHAVVFVPNGGTGGGTVAITAGQGWADITAPSITAPTGWTFAGWFTNSGVTGGTELPTEGEIAAGAPLRFYARFTRLITFNANGGAMTGSATTTVVRGQDWNVVTAPTITPPGGSTFINWFNINAADGGEFLPPSGLIADEASMHTFWARFALNDDMLQTVTFNAAGGEFPNGQGSATRQALRAGNYGQVLTTAGSLAAPALGAPTRDLYTFTGWFVDNARIQPSTPVTNEPTRTLTARWERSHFIVTFETDDAADEVRVAANTMVANRFVEPAEGYQFVGWADESGVRWNFHNRVTRDMTLTPIFVREIPRITQVVVFHGAEGTPRQQSVRANGTYGDAFSQIGNPGVTRPGYRFVGWFTWHTGGTEITADTHLTGAPARDLYARWERIG